MRKPSTNGDVVLRIIDFLEKGESIYPFANFVIFCRFLELLGDPAAVPGLINLLKKYGEKHTKYAKSQTEEDQSKAGTIYYLLKAATDALIGIGEAAVQPLIELLESEHVELRKFAAYALGKIGRGEAFPALEKIFREPEQPEIVREAAGRALLQLDPQKASKIVQAEKLTPTEDPHQIKHILKKDLDLKWDLEVINWYYGSLEGLGPPSDYKQSVSLYKHIEPKTNYFKYSDVEYHELEEERFWDFFNEEADRFMEELKLPQELIEEVGETKDQFFPCLCGEYLNYAFVDALSKRISEDSHGHCAVRDVICIYCKNCKRYTALERFQDDRYPEEILFDWFYLPRFPKQTELKREKEIKIKREDVAAIFGFKDPDQEDYQE